MKKTQVLYRQNIGRLIKKYWYNSGKLKVNPTSTEDILNSYGYEAVDIKEFLHGPKDRKEFKVIGFYDKELPKNEKHPDYKKEPCFLYKDEDVLIEGLEQAKVLTNTVEIEKGLPSSLLEQTNKLNLPDELVLEVKKRVKLSCLLEATQEKLPKRKDPLKPSWVFPREYGIGDRRKNDLLCKNLVTICEKISSTKSKAVVLEAFFSSPVQAHSKKLQFEIKSELLVTTQKQLKEIADSSSTHNIALPKIYPMDCTAGLKPFHFYQMKNIYPIKVKSKWPYIQTAFLHLNKTQVKNTIEEEITESQIQGRSLLKGFTIASAQARALYGENVVELPQPVVVPIIQTDGQLFDFALYQLNTLHLDVDSPCKNIFWCSERISMYSACEYQSGRPVLLDFNPDVIKKIITFYNIC